MTELSTLRLPTRTEIAATRAAKEEESKVFLATILPAALKAEILRYYCDKAMKQMATGADEIYVPPNTKEWEDNVSEKLKEQYAAMHLVWKFTFTDLFHILCKRIGADIPKWMKEIEGFEDYEMDGDLVLKSKP